MGSEIIVEHGWCGEKKKDQITFREVICSLKLVELKDYANVFYDYQYKDVKLRLTGEDFEEIDEGQFQEAFIKFGAKEEITK